MQKRRLGDKGPRISVVGYGAWEIGGEAYGPNPEESQVIAAIRAGIDAGIDWIDTAEVYGQGNSEHIVGRAIKGIRDELTIATKVAPKPVGTGYEPDAVKEAAKKSLKRMNIDHIDLYQLHWRPDDETPPLEDTWGAMAELVDEGLVRYIGVSNFTEEQIAMCHKNRHCDSLQPQYSILHRDDEALFKWCEHQGIGVIVYGPLAYGLLSGKMNRETEFDPSDWRSGKNPDHPYYVELFEPRVFGSHLETVERLRPFADSKGISVGQLALAWAFSQPGVTAVIAGSRNAVHNAENAAAGDVVLAAPDLERIEALIAGR
ncbi:MAG: aldo/keto reductase [Actinomycetota bacterium]|nr:aldo/keto reductase [Actinomycetota bacterium]